MGRLAEILSSGKAPGYAGIAKDEGCPQVAVPRAIREMESGTSRKTVFGPSFCSKHSKGMSVREIERATQTTPGKLKKVWFKKQNL